jgi:hypothetical protein
LVSKSLETFQYPELSLLFAFPLVAIIFSFRNTIKKLEKNLQRDEENLELQPTNEQLLEGNGETAVNNQQRKFKKIKETHLYLKYLCFVLLVLSVVAHCASMSTYQLINDCNYSSYYFPIAAQFIVGCGPGQGYTPNNNVCLRTGEVPNIIVNCNSWKEIYDKFKKVEKVNS